MRTLGSKAGMDEEKHSRAKVNFASSDVHAINEISVMKTDITDNYGIIRKVNYPYPTKMIKKKTRLVRGSLT